MSRSYWFSCCPLLSHLSVSVVLSVWLLFDFLGSVLVSFCLYSSSSHFYFHFLYIHHSAVLFPFLPFPLLFLIPPLSPSFPPSLSPLSASPSLSFFPPPAVVGSKWVSDGCNPILQIQQKWWLGCSLSSHFCECVCISVTFFPCTHLVIFSPLLPSLFFSFIQFFSLALSLSDEGHIWQGA